MKPLEAIVYTQQGKEAGKVSLPAHVFGLPWNADLVHQVAVSMMTSARKPVAHTQTRGEVRGGGKKPWQQKGTGRARHGSIRSPLWPGGGVAHGPRNDKNFDRKVNKKMKAKAIYTLLSKKFREGEIIFVDSIAPSESKTKLAVGIMQSLSKVAGIEALSTKSKNAAYIALAENNIGAKRSFANIGSVSVEEVRNLNPLDLLKYKFVIVDNPKVSIDMIASKLPAKTEGKPAGKTFAKKAPAAEAVKKAAAKKPVKAAK